jgi:hypothetical protein
MEPQVTSEELQQRPIGEVASDLARDVSLLVRQELELARKEMGEKARAAVPGVAMLGGAVVVAMCAAGALTAFLVLALANALDAWLAALIVGLVLAGLAAALGLAGKQAVEDMGPPVPEQAIRSVKEDAQWVKEQASSGRR